MRRTHALFIALLAFVGASCGGSSSGAQGGDSAASIAPASALVFLSVDTDLESEQWQQVDELLKKFPGGRSARDLVDETLEEDELDYDRDVAPSVGPTIEFVYLDFEQGGDNFVALTKPKDADRFEALLKKGDDPVVFREIAGWTAVAQTKAVLDRFEQARGGASLAANANFEDAMAELPEDAVVKAFVNGDRVLEALKEALPSITVPAGTGRVVAGSAAVEAADDGFRVLAFVRSEGGRLEQANDIGGLLDRVPSDAFAFADFSGETAQLELREQLEGTPELEEGVDAFEQLLGVELDELVKLFGGEGILFVRPGAIIPEITLLLEVANGAEATRTLDRLAKKAATLLGETPSVQSRTIDGIEAKEVDLGRFSIFYAAASERLVVTSQSAGVAALRDRDDSIADSERYKDALEAAGVEEGERVSLYVNLERSMSLVEQVAQLGGDTLPPGVRKYLDPLRTFLVSAQAEGNDGTFRFFLELK